MTKQSEATVYLNESSGVYHRLESCTGQQTGESTLSEMSLLRASNYGRACSNCIFKSSRSRRVTND